MSETKAGRGRPKGSGLNDSAQLAAIEKLLANDPQLKPTTAIKMSGVTDPSAVRRLRDKLSANRTGHAGTASDPVPPDVIATTVTESAKTTSRPAVQPCTVPTGPQLKSKTELKSKSVKTAAPPAAPSVNERTEPAERPASSAKLAEALSVSTTDRASADWLASLGSLGLTAFAASFEFQLAFFGQALRLPPVSVALKQQLLLNEMTLAFCLPASESTRTLH